MRDVFISYSKKDRPWAEWIAHVLTEAGVHARLDSRELTAGDNVVAWMSEALAASDKVLAIVTPDYLSSASERSEVERASILWNDVDRAGRIVPVVVKDATLPPVLAPLLSIDLRNLDEESARQALVNGLIPRSDESARFPPFPGALDAVQ